LDLQKKKADNQKIVMVTAYDFTMARLMDAAGVDMVLVGDSLGMVVQGQSDTLPVTMDEMVYHTRCVHRALHHSCLRRSLLLVGNDVHFVELVSGVWTSD
jgi:3-methyl-2-oxobutanoate hydroxymethyltransferase